MKSLFEQMGGTYLLSLYKAVVGNGVQAEPKRTGFTIFFCQR